MFKETSAQHFFSFAGDGSWESFTKESLSCWKRKTDGPESNFTGGSCNPRLVQDLDLDLDLVEDYSISLPLA